MTTISLLSFRIIHTDETLIISFYPTHFDANKAKK